MKTRSGGKLFLASRSKLIVFSVFISLIFHSCAFNKRVQVFKKAFDTAGENINKGLEKHVPTGVTELLNVPYHTTDTDAKLDVYYPSGSDWKNKPSVVWIHGGGWIAGSKEHISNYAKILAHEGFTVIAVEYSLAPERKHPTPVLQINSSLTFLSENAEKYHFNPRKIVIGGDSGGAQIAAQLGIVLSDEVYAKKLGVVPSVTRNNISGMILYCGTYNFSQAEKGTEGIILRMMMRAYSGKKNFKKKSYFALGSVTKHIPTTYPSTFISVGNKDILKKHSYELAEILKEKGIKVDSLFFENDKVSLNHEYQFDLDNESGKLALQRTVKFINGLDDTASQIKIKSKSTSF